MVECHKAKYCSLHVRRTNYAAFHLYKDTLKFNVHNIEAKYYADGEDAYEMRKPLSRETVGLPPLAGDADKENDKKKDEKAGGAGAGGVAARLAAKRKKPAAGGGGEASKEEEVPATPGSGGVASGDNSSAAAMTDEALLAELGDIEPGAKDLKAAVAGGGGGGGGKAKKGGKKR